MAENQEWYSLTKASEKLGYGRTYVSVWLRRHKDDFPSNMLMESGNSKMISEQGIEWIKENIKKEGVLVSNSGANEYKYLILVLLGKAHNIYFTICLIGRLLFVHTIARNAI
ncbi:hypothetical protein EFM07_12535 [Lactococcus lactis]|uniref:hypothetical protein n=1 Tax=Lactococcus lactis TaxID=1358 RepID=UPI00223B9F1C|nr:hypothetical protein [Lactococcus lactis]MCT1228178.1 hypothetical protein [Lactococcus lactis]